MQMRIWEVGRAMPGTAPSSAVGKAEIDAGGPILDLEWKDDGMHVFGVGCNKIVKLWSLQTNQLQDIGSVRELLHLRRRDDVCVIAQ